MRKLKLLILLFSLALCIPLAYFVLRTYDGLAQEEVATLSYFAEALFDEMEQTLAVMVQKEESRAIDEYNFLISPSSRQSEAGEMQPSPLSQPSEDNFILGYFQNNPDGSFQTPLVDRDGNLPTSRSNIVAELKNANQIFNRMRVVDTDRIQSLPAEIVAKEKAGPKPGFADKYLDSARSRRSREFLGQSEKRVEQITINQAANIAKQEQPQPMSHVQVDEVYGAGQDDRYTVQSGTAGKAKVAKKSKDRNYRLEEAESDIAPASASGAGAAADYRVEVAPLQAVFLSDAQIFIFRRIMIDGQIYRQGFVLLVDKFLNHLGQTYFLNQPMAQFTGLRLSVFDQGRASGAVEYGVASQNPDFIINRSFWLKTVRHATL